MQITKFAIFALLSVVSASPAKRTAAQIQTAVTTISTNLDTVDTQIKAFTGSIFQAIPLLTAVNTLESSITSATTTVTSTGALSAADSTTVLSSVSALGPKISTVLADVVAKKSVVASAGFTSIVHDALVTLKNDSDAFLGALGTTIDSSLASSVASLQATVDAVFTATIASFT